MARRPVGAPQASASLPLVLLNICVLVSVSLRMWSSCGWGKQCFKRWSLSLHGTQQLPALQERQLGRVATLLDLSFVKHDTNTTLY